MQPVTRPEQISVRSTTNRAGKDHERTLSGVISRLRVWLMLHGVDLITLSILGAIALGISYASPVHARSFPVYFLNGEVVFPELAYPFRENIIRIWLVVFISFVAPLLFITVFQIRRRSLEDWLTTSLGVVKSLATSAAFQVIIKWIIGGFRPHFLDICQPNIPAGSGNGFASLMYDASICTGVDKKRIENAQESMPSGHATAAWSGLFYLALYLNAQLKIMSAHNPAYWKMVLLFAPILGACLISGALVVDHSHHWYDVVAGAVIGICTATVSFRQTFAAVLDFRFNHILLPRATSLLHRSPHIEARQYFAYGASLQECTSYNLPATREGGWTLGSSVQFSGAPGDASAFMAGSNSTAHNLSRGQDHDFAATGREGGFSSLNSTTMDRQVLDV